jgi:tellurite resistance protein
MIKIPSTTAASAAAAATAAVAEAGLLGYLPVALFGSVMGLTGLSVSWRQSHAYFGTPLWIAHAFGAIAILAFVVLTVAYAIKTVSSPDKVRAEFLHPVAGNLFGTPLISLLLLPMLLAEFSLPLARGMWIVGAVLMPIFAWRVVGRWLHVRQQPAHATPAWIIPVVGLLDLPLAVPSLHLDGVHGLMMFGLSVGLFFAVPLFTLVLSRLLFEEKMPDSMQPSLLILVAPFAVGFSAYVTTIGTIDSFAQALYMLMLFLLTVLVVRLVHLRDCCPFRVSWWAVSFPLAASANTAIRYAQAGPGSGSVVTDVVAIALLTLATLVILGLLVRTLVGLVRGDMRTLSA